MCFIQSTTIRRKNYTLNMLVCLLIPVFLSGVVSGQSSQPGNPIVHNGKQQSLDVVQQELDVKKVVNECTNYKLSIGKYTNFFYTCCGELKVENPPITGNEEIVANWDCNPTRIRYTTINETARFDCNGSVGQQSARYICNARWGWAAEEDCWAWSVCFKGACQAVAKEAGAPPEGFCGDGRCDMRENSNSCPGDCCPQSNPDDCLMRNNTCTKACCSESTCCASETSAFFGHFWTIVFSIIGGVFLLINVCCCCCCYCFYKRCKGVRPKQKHPTKVDRQDTTMTVLSM